MQPMVIRAAGYLVPLLFASTAHAQPGPDVEPVPLQPAPNAPSAEPPLPREPSPAPAAPSHDAVQVSAPDAGAAPSHTPASAVEAPVAEESAPDAELGAVVITADRTETALQKEPAAVSAVGPAEIQRRGIKNLMDGAGAIVGLHLSHGGGNHQQPVSIRGLGGQGGNAISAIGFYLDDVYLGRTFGRGEISLPDIERIEVLRGPQGTAFGQAVSGGAIRIVSRNPSFTDPYNWVSVSLGTYGAREAQIYLSTPIVEHRLSASLAFSHRQNDGDHYNAFLKSRVNRTFADQLRGKLRWSPTDKLDIQLTLDGTTNHSDNNVQTPFNGPVFKPRLIFAGAETRSFRVDVGQTLTLSYDLDEHLQLRSISAHRDDKTPHHRWDFDGLPADIDGHILRLRERIWSQEFQLKGTYDQLTFVAGAIYYQSQFDEGRHYWTTVDGVPLDLQKDNSDLYRSYAAYAQATYRIIEQLGITAGIRYGWRDETFDGARYNADHDGTYLDPVYVVKDQKYDETILTPKVGLDVALTQDLLGYASYTFGQRPGGYNASSESRLLATTPVGAEKVRTAEAGFKTQFFDRRLTFNAAGFHSQFDDYQQSVQNPVIDGRPVQGSVIVNAGQATLYGAELETVIRPVQSLELRANATFLHTRFDDFLNPTGAANQDFTGNQIPHAPKLLAFASVVWDLPAFGIPGNIQLNGSINYVGKTYTEITNNEEYASDVRTLVNGGLSYSTPNGHWTFTLIVRNALDKNYRFASQRLPAGTYTARWGAPRTILATLRYEL
ncbi:MAG: TonB-dependent receptor [Polyangiales bacterium]